MIVAKPVRRLQGVRTKGIPTDVHTTKAFEFQCERYEPAGPMAAVSAANSLFHTEVSAKMMLRGPTSAAAHPEAEILGRLGSVTGARNN